MIIRVTLFARSTKRVKGTYIKLVLCGIMILTQPWKPNIQTFLTVLVSHLAKRTQLFRNSKPHSAIDSSYFCTYIWMHVHLSTNSAESLPEVARLCRCGILVIILFKCSPLTRRETKQ